MKGVYLHKSGTESTHFIHGLSNTRLYRIWANMKSRCLNPKSTRFEHWGGRGIAVCDEWKNDFKAFYDWSMSNGYRDGLTIDRINGQGSYEPSNCRWVTHSIQNKNKRTSNLITFQGRTQNLVDWEQETGINHRTISARLKHGWSVEDALTKKVIRT